MLEFFFNTIIKRPYVFIFLFCFLLIGIIKMGFLRTLLYLLWGYTIAWISEALSIRFGFPYGQYFYIYENLKGEWLNWGVPVWDSASYTFLTFAGFGLAQKIIPGQKKLKMILLASLFVTLLDIVVDPLAHLGERWFLGKIYYYAHPGFYFDVPLSNFIGWYAVAFVIIGGFIFIEKYLPAFQSWNTNSRLVNLIGKYGITGLYFGIFFFNWILTLSIGEYSLALIDLIWISIPVFFLFPLDLFKRHHYM